MKKLIIIIALAFIGCKEDAPEPDSFCIYLKPRDGLACTNAQGCHEVATFATCVDNPYYTVNHKKFKGYATFNCNCESTY
jgi:hypothetical protein